MRSFFFYAAITLNLLLYSSVNAQWTQFQGNAEHTGYAGGSGLPRSQNAAWTFETAPPTDATPPMRFTKGIASDGENIYLAWIGSPSTINGVSSIDINTGVENWEFLYQGNDSETISAPAYSDGHVYVHRWGHSSSCGGDCHDKPRLIGIRTNTGTQILTRITEVNGPLAVGLRHTVTAFMSQAAIMAAWTGTIRSLGELNGSPVCRKLMAGFPLHMKIKSLQVLEEI